MKRTNKIIAVLLTVLLLLGAVAIIAAATESTPETQTEKAPIKEGYFLFYDASAKTFTECKNSTLDSTLKSLQDGDVITLLSNVTVTRRAWTSMSNAGKGYLDLNGYRFSAYADLQGHYFLIPAKNSTLYIYSSDDTYKSRIFASATSQTNGQQTGITFINTRNDGAHVYMGDAEGAPVAVKNGSSWSLSEKNCDGDNLEYIGATLFSSWKSGTNDNPQSSSLNLRGGTYYQTNSGTLFTNDSGVDINLQDAKIISRAGGTIFSCGLDDTVTVEPTYDDDGELLTPGTVYLPADGSFTAKNCFFYTTGSFMGTAYESKANPEYSVNKSEIYLENCDIVSRTLINNNQSNPEFKNCRFSGGFFSDSENKLVKTNKNETVLILKNEFSFTTYTEEVTKDGETVTEYVGSINESSFDVTGETVEFNYQYMTTTGTNYVDITWVDRGESITESWSGEEGIYPIPPILPTQNEVYAYDYYPQIKTTAETGNITYTLKPHINFTLRANIALYADFTYNLYIPESAADSELFNWARIDSLTESGAVYETGAVNTVKGGKVANLEVAKDVFEKNYVLTQDISAFEGDTEYQLVINVDDGFGGTFEHIQKFSIFDYADRVNEGNYTAEAKDLVNYTKAYIKAACNYATEDGALRYPTESNADLAAVLGTASSAEKATPSDEVRKVFYGMNLSLDESIKFSFYLHPGFTDSVTFHYPVNTKYTSVTISAADCTSDDTFGENLLRYDISMRAIDLRGRIVIDISSTPDIKEDYSYRLSNYVHSIKDQPETTRLLVDSLWAYSLASYNYLKVADSDSPTVTVSVAGNQVTADSYVIVASDPNGKAAIALRDAILAKTGEKLAISANEVDGKKSIYVNLTEPNRTYDFTAYVKGSDLVINCGFESFIDGAMSSFLSKNVNTKNTDIKFDTGFRDNYYTKNIYYSDFGAYGIDMDALVEEFGSKYADIKNWQGDSLTTIRSSLTNDFAAIKAAHDFANVTGRHTLYAEDSAVYYISESLIGTSVNQIIIKTPVVWGNANIVIDDSDIPNYSNTASTAHELKKSQGGSHLFAIKSTYDKIRIDSSEILNIANATGIKPGTKVIDLGLGYPAMIVPYNENHNVYRRKGYGSWAGSAMHEVILVDENGKVSRDTPIMFDYSNVDYFEVYRTDIDHMTVEGGTFTTIASSLPTNTGTGYIARGMQIQRSNTTVKNVKHVIIGEITVEQQNAGILGSAYNGFFAPSSGANITLDGCVLQGRRCYSRSGGTTGTYDFSASLVANIILKNCTQSNFWVDDYANPVAEGTPGAKLSMSSSSVTGKAMHWGLGGTNFCKNMVYENSTLSRFDAHAGLYNGKIINSTISGLEVVGNGELLLDNVRWFASNSSAAYNSIISLRADYGCTWTGDIILKNVKAYPYEGTNVNFGTANQYPTALVYHHYNNWYYGYECHFPNITVDNMEYYSRNTGKLLSGDEVGAIDLAVKALSRSSITYSFITEPNLHLDKTAGTHPVFEDVDKDKDGLVDGTNIAYDGSAADSGVTDSSSYVNRNKIVPPEYIKILNNKQGYDFTTKIAYYKTKTTFFDNTKIIIINDGESPDSIKDNDSPFMPY